MSTFTLHTMDSAPAASKPLLENSTKGFGMIPALHGMMAESPQLLEGYQRLHQLFQQTSFNKDELTVVWQSINVEHECHYCVPAHAMIADAMKVDPALTQALRDQQPLADAKLEALRNTTLILVRQRGQISEAQLEAFYRAGYSQKNVLEIILGIAQKVMSNFTNHVADTPLDERFQPFA